MTPLRCYPIAYRLCKVVVTRKRVVFYATPLDCWAGGIVSPGSAW